MPRNGRPKAARLVAGIFVTVALTLSAISSRAAAPDVVVYGEPTLARALRDVGARFTAQTGAPVHVFSAPPTLILAQLRHQVWNDVVVTQVPWMDQAEQEGVIVPGTRTGVWHNSLVLARASRPANDGGKEIVAVTDPTQAATIDGLAVLTAMGLHPVAVQEANSPLSGAIPAAQGWHPTYVQGVANTAEVGFLLQTGAAAQGLVYLTDVRADPKLSVVAPVTATAAIVYTAAISRLTHSPNARAFLNYLVSPAPIEVLRLDGEESAP
jgi:ABC-type molybdate transport system substrate-binding protein